MVVCPLEETSRFCPLAGAKISLSPILNFPAAVSTVTDIASGDPENSTILSPSQSKKVLYFKQISLGPTTGSSNESARVSVKDRDRLLSTRFCRPRASAVGEPNSAEIWP
jgi:hypothetical protein